MEELSTVLWAYRTTNWASTGETPFNLVYGTEALIPIKVDIQSSCVLAFDEQRHQEQLFGSLDLIDELSDQDSI